jgi:hypothetical protein
MLITVFSFGTPNASGNNRRYISEHPAEHGIDFSVIMARLRCASARQARTHTSAVKSRFPSPAIPERPSKIANNRVKATAI